jgi:DNA-binding NarL/FixJ family response regulator
VGSGELASVLVIDDEPIVHGLIRRVLRDTPHTVVGEATDSQSGMTAWRALAPDVVIIDHLMPGTTGLDTAVSMLAEVPGQPIILFTATPDLPMFLEAEALGIAACVAKSDAASLPGVVAIVLGEPTAP